MVDNTSCEITAEVALFLSRSFHELDISITGNWCHLPRLKTIRNE